MQMFIGVDPGPLDKNNGNHGIALYDQSNSRIEKALSIEGVSQLEYFLLDWMANYPVHKCGVEICRLGGGWGNVDMRCKIHETIGAIKFILRIYGTWVVEIAPHVIAQEYGREKQDRIAYCQSHLSLASCNEHMADASLIALLTSQNKYRKMSKL